MKLFIDDKREPPDDTWKVVRTYQEGVEHVRIFGCPAEVSFDHDLGMLSYVDGKEKSGLDFANHLIDLDLNLDGRFIPADFSFNVHSANPVGAENIRGTLGGYLEFKKDHMNVAVQEKK